MASNLTTAGATVAMAALDGAYFVGVGTGKNASGLIGEPTGNGYGRVAVTITATGATATNAGAIVFSGATATFAGLTHAGLFTLASGGDCHWVGELNAAATYEAGGTLTIQAGDFDLAVAVTA
jgi:hypothetical protein